MPLQRPPAAQRPKAGASWLQGYKERRRYLKLRKDIILLQRFIRRKMGNQQQAEAAHRQEAADVLLAFLKDLAGSPRLTAAVAKARKNGELPAAAIFAQRFGGSVVRHACG